MSFTEPSNELIESVFSRLRQQPANKVCFDCGAKNPTWSSVTFGVFICIDCSAVHRSLGVHLTFVRSINLDTNWTWVQLRQMQLGGNANASQFFRQHNCTTNDTQQKYNSRAAQLYKEKLSSKSNQAMKIYGTKLDLEVQNEKLDDNVVDDELGPQKDLCDDIFDSEYNERSKNQFTLSHTKDMLATSIVNKVEPSTDFLNSTVTMDTPKSTIGTRKIVQKKSNLGAKKGFLGATKVKTNFEDLEEKANNADKTSLDMNYQSTPSKNEEIPNIESVRLAYQDISLQKQKKEDQMKRVDPQKAKQLERLGMGFINKGEVSHSAMTDMKTLYQENTKVAKFADRENFKDFFDEYSISMHNTTTKSDNDLTKFDRNEYPESQITTQFSKTPYLSINEQPGKSKVVEKKNIKSYENDAAQKKFGSAKGISSDQYFGEEQSTDDKSAQLSRFQGSSSISSSDYFGTDNKSQNSGQKSYDTSSNYHDMDDVKESVRQGVTKVAGRLSSLANDVMSSLQEKYGY